MCVCASSFDDVVNMNKGWFGNQIVIKVVSNVKLIQTRTWLITDDT